MNDIKFFLKFGEREHLEGLQKGELYFSNAKTFRYYEEKLLIKGQGDQLEGGSMFIANNLSPFFRIIITRSHNNSNFLSPCRTKF